MHGHDFKIIDQITFCKVNLYNLDTTINFGKFKGQQIHDILKIDPWYINFCILNVDFFCISDEVLNQINNTFKSFRLSPFGEKRRKNKLRQWCQQIEEKKERESRASSYEMNDDHYGDYEEDYYNDNLDMDQQCEDFYTTVIEKEPEGWNQYEEDEGVSLIKYAKKLSAYGMILFESKETSYIEIYKSKNLNGKLDFLKKLKVKDNVTNGSLANLMVITENAEDIAVVALGVKVLEDSISKEIICVNINNHGYGKIHLVQEEVFFDGYVAKILERTTFLEGKIEELKAFNYKSGQIITGKILQRESKNPFFAGQKAKTNPISKTIILLDGSPIYAMYFFTRDMSAQDELLDGAFFKDT